MRQQACRDEERPTSRERAVLERAPICTGRGTERCRERGWKLFLLLPRMLLHRPPRGGLISKEKLGARFQLFAQGQWAASASCDDRQLRDGRRRRVNGDDLERRAKRAELLVGMGELSSARQALEGAELALGTNETLQMLSDHSNAARKPKVQGSLLQACREVGPRMGRMTALRNADGRVRGIVAGDVIRKLMARTISQQPSQAVEAATAPFQYALSTRAGCKCIAHTLQGLTELNPRATVLSKDGISANDQISRGAMLSGLLDVEGGGQALPFVRMFYGSPSSYSWEDLCGVSHTIRQGEGGEQGGCADVLVVRFGPTQGSRGNSVRVARRRILVRLFG